MIMVDEVVNKTITDLHISYKEQNILTRRMGQTTTQHTTGGAMTSRRLEQRQIQEEDLVAVLFIEDSDRRESWLNCGALVYDQRMPNKRPKSRPPLIGTFFADDEVLVVLGSYEDIILSESGMCMKMIGPGDKEKLLETCRNIVIENNSNSDTNGDAVSTAP